MTDKKKIAFYKLTRLAHEGSEATKAGQKRDKFREDFKEEFEFLDWLKSLPEDEKREYLATSDVIEDGKDPTVIDFGDEDLDEWVKKYNLYDADEWLEQIRNLTVDTPISSLPKRPTRNITQTKKGTNA